MKQWWSVIPPISTKQINHLSPQTMEDNKGHDIWLRKSRSLLGTDTQMWLGLNQLMGNLHLIIESYASLVKCIWKHERRFFLLTMKIYGFLNSYHVLVHCQLFSSLSLTYYMLFIFKTNGSWPFFDIYTCSNIKKKPSLLEQYCFMLACLDR
jgi:hypothetical protein